MRRRMVLLAVLAVGLLSAAAAETPQTVPRYPLASRADLHLSSAGCGCRVPPDGGPALFAVPLPGRDTAVLLRPLTEEEVASYLVQAIDWQLIEAEILAAALVWPSLTAGDLFGLPPEINDHLRRAVNEISGFEVLQPAPGIEDVFPRSDPADR